VYSYPLSWLKRSTPAPATAREAAPRNRFRPNLDILEDRTCPATLPDVNLPIDVGNVTLVRDVNDVVTGLRAPVNIAGQQAGFLNILAEDVSTTAGADCTVLNLEIQPISLNLLGLHVDTSAICLNITGDPDEGLLGQLVCGLAGGSLDLGDLIDDLGGLGASLNTLLGQVEDLLDGLFDEALTVTDVLGTAVNSAVSNQVTTQQDDQGFCDILNLSLGPVDLTLLGLTVELDNCATPAGPVTVDVTADPSGGLLGGLLCGLADGPLNGQLISRLIGRLDTLIDRVGDLADRLDEIDLLPARLGRIADRLVDQLQKVANRVDSLADLDRLISRLDRLTDRLDRIIENTDLPPRVTRQLEALLGQLTRIINRFDDLGLVGRLSTVLERTIDRIFARL